MSDSTAPVTVIIPCLNAEDTLGDALDSVFAQTVLPQEVLVIDDHSTDRSAAIARSYDGRVRVLMNPGRGMGVARGLGAKQAKGTYIAFVDADDLIEPCKHEKQLAILENSDPATVVHTGSMIVQRDNCCPPRFRGGGGTASGRCTRTIFERNPLCSASIMVRRSVVLEVGNYDPDLRRSQDFNMSLATSTCCDFVYIPDPLYIIYRHERNVTNHKVCMAYYHWLAQERFRQQFPKAFSQLPAESVQKYMIEPVLRSVKEAYWHRESDGYQRLLRLAVKLAPEDPEIQTLWRRRRVPMWALRAWDRMSLRNAIPQRAAG